MIEPKLAWQTGEVKREGNYMLEGREYCKHDSIPRKCDSCDYEDEIKRMREIINDAHTRLSNMHGHEWEEVTSRVQDILEVDK